uniref:Centriolar satellite-associated tubulin polyglutamylase complex regulator 1 n=1 Tax=Aureoumbra lagunensis TaxID=44058 RepID=A0A7S3NL44_9STRA
MGSSSTTTTRIAAVDEEDGKAYLDRVELYPYLEDAIRKGKTSVNSLRKYFQSVLDMRHIAGREFEFVCATKWNRRSFLSVLSATTEQLGNDIISATDLYQIIALICPDFPQELVLETFFPLFIDSDVAPYRTLVSAFAIFFYYEPTFRILATTYTNEDQDVFAVNSTTNNPLPLALLSQTSNVSTYKELCRSVLTATQHHKILLSLPSPLSDDDSSTFSQQSSHSPPLRSDINNQKVGGSSGANNSSCITGACGAMPSKRPASSRTGASLPSHCYNNGGRRRMNSTRNHKITASSSLPEETTATSLSSRPLQPAASSSR